MEISLSSSKFAALIAWDAGEISNEEVSRVARWLLDAGAVYVCAWGRDCSRVHDMVDLEDIGPDPDPNREYTVMTTWHPDEPLSEAIYFALNLAFPHEVHESACASTLAISIGSAAWAEEIRRAFSDPKGFTSKLAEGQ